MASPTSKDFPSLEGQRIVVTGGTGFLGSHLCYLLEAQASSVVPISKSMGYDLRNTGEALSALVELNPSIVVHLAATVGGIGANMNAPATFFRDNMLMGMEVIHACALRRVKLVMVGTICSYPKYCKVPFKEESFWDGYPEETNAPYGISKKALFVMMEAYAKQYGLKYAYLVPCNLYGPGDNFSEETSHVIPALIKKFVHASESKKPEVTCWGTGNATRSFLHVKDAARAISIACKRIPIEGVVNLPGSEEISISDLASLISKIVGYQGKIKWDPSRPDGQPRRSVDGTKAEEILDWRPSVQLNQGLTETVEWYISDRERVST